MKDIGTQPVVDVFDPLFIDSCVFETEMSSIEGLETSEYLPVLVEVCLDQFLSHFCEIQNIFIPGVSCRHGQVDACFLRTSDIWTLLLGEGQTLNFNSFRHFFTVNLLELSFRGWGIMICIVDLKDANAEHFVIRLIHFIVFLLAKGSESSCECSV